MTRMWIAITFLFYLSDAQNMLSVHFAKLHATKAHLWNSSPLPVSALGPILRLSEESMSGISYADLMENEHTARASGHLFLKYEYILCSPQDISKKARKRIQALDSSAKNVPIQVFKFLTFTYHHTDVRCAQ